MGKNDNETENNEFDKQINEIKNYQDNMYNPGHWVGTGRVAPFQRNIVKRAPWLLMIIGAVPIGVVIHNFNGSNILNYLYGNSMVIIISLILFFAGLVNLIDKIKPFL